MSTETTKRPVWDVIADLRNLADSGGMNVSLLREAADRMDSVVADRTELFNEAVRKATKIRELEAELARVIQAVRFVHAEHEGRCVSCEERCDCLDLDDMALVGDCTHSNAEWPCTTIQQLDAAITPAQVQP